MAITPKSFLINPKLLAAIVLAVAGVSGVAVAAFGPYCRASLAPESLWTAAQWASTAERLIELDRPRDAYKVTARALSYFPTDSHLLNMRGIAALRDGDYGTAASDFRVGQRLTGSPTGLFENNIAWTTLYSVGEVPPERGARLLLQTRALYRQSMTKGWTCERLHTALFVEYAIADHAARQRDASTVRDAVQRYRAIYADYAPCLSPVRASNLAHTAEIVSAAAMDVEMGKIAGIKRPSRHIGSLNLAVTHAGETLDGAWCEREVPVAAAAARCAVLTGE